MTLTSSQLLDIDPLVQTVATEYGRKFWKFGLESPDVAQELWVWVVQHPTKVTGWMAEENGHRPLLTTLRNEAKRHGMAAKASVLGYSLDDLAFYSRGEISVLLDAMFDDEAWVEPPATEPGSRRGGDPATGGNWLATLADVSRAFEQLPDAERSLLTLFHRDGESNRQVAEMLGVSEQATSKRHAKALEKLHRLLGGHKPKWTHDPVDCECSEYVGTRRAMSNAAARAKTEHQYDED